MSTYQICRLWEGAATILTTNLLESGVVHHQFNHLLTQVAVAAFDDFTNNKPSLISKRENEAPSAGRRRRRASTPLQKNNSDHPPSLPSTLSHDNSSSALKTTPNDNFFEFQRMRGYRLASPYISDCDAARQLEEEHVVGAVSHYLQQFPTSIAKSIANQIEACDAGISIDLWAAVQRGPGAYHAFHVHEGVIVSGVYYSNCPSGCAPLILKKPSGGNTFDAINSDHQRYNSEQDGDGIEKEDVIIHPKEGQLVLFPPWLSHGVPMVNEAKQNAERLDNNLPRVSWAFNLTGRFASIGDPWSATCSSVRDFNRKNL
mmetsp:Transcript_12437/g.26468  ORF Transcript_12437/g.26468 Transcript_12437/m.26468 type:complete len:316 (-) Transcript_12437:16-963(-)